MNRTELIEKIIEVYNGKGSAPLLREILQLHLPDFQRIDEERMGKILNNIVGSSIYYDQLLRKSVTLEAVRIYNSTLSKAPAQPPALKPLPKEMPEWFDKKVSEWMNNSNIRLNQVWQDIISNYGTPANNLQPLPKAMPDLWHNALTDLLHDRMQPSEFYSLIRKTYGTPEPKQPLPTVEELAKEMLNVWNVNTFNEVAEYVIDKYSLHHPSVVAGFEEWG